MEVFVRELGLTPLQAIQCSTQANAFAMRMAGKVGEVLPGRLADLLIVDGDPATDVTVLGDPACLKQVLLGGRSVDLTPDAPRRDPPGWRVSTYGARLGKDVAAGAPLAPSADLTEP